MVQQYTQKEMLDMLRRCKEEFGACTPRNFNAMDNSCSASAIMRRFGSWSDAKDDAGIDEDLSSRTGRSQKYTDEDILNHIRECARLNDGKVTVELLQQNKDLVAPSVAVERFGSWLEAKKKAGIDVDERSSNHRPRKFSDEDYLELLRECEEKHGKVTQRQFDKDDDYPSSGAVADRFGSWKDAKEEAGVQVSQHKHTDEELLEMLRECKRKHGKCTAKLFASEEGYASPETLQRRFGSWSDAKKTAGVN